jgi:hypothetical protein
MGLEIEANAAWQRELLPPVAYYSPESSRQNQTSAWEGMKDEMNYSFRPKLFSALYIVRKGTREERNYSEEKEATEYRSVICHTIAEHNDLWSNRPRADSQPVDTPASSGHK